MPPQQLKQARQALGLTQAEIAALMADAGLIVLVALISPLEKDRVLAKETIGGSRFTLVFVDTPLEVCEQRDPKGLYKKARDGLIPNFTGISAPFQIPSEGLRTSRHSASDILKIVLDDSR